MEQGIKKTETDRLRVCHLLWSYTVGGIESMLIDIANEQSRNADVHIVIINNHYNRQLIDTFAPEVKVHLINRPPKSRNPWWVLKINAVIAHIRPDIVHSHMPGIWKYYFLPFPKVYTAHSCMIRSRELDLQQKTFCISRAVQQHAKEIGCTDTEIIYNGIRTDLVETRSQYPIPGGKTAIVCVGRLSDVKGQHILIEACRQLVNKHNRTDFHVDFIGDGDARDRLEKMVADYGLDNYISFIGLLNRQEIYTKLKNYDLFVMPSTNEGFGLTLAEACAAKVPVLTCDLSGPLEVIGDGAYGLTFKTGSSDSLADKLLSYLDNRVPEETIEEAYNNVRRNFSVAATAQNYLNAYRRLLSKN